MKMNGAGKKHKSAYHFNCGYHMRYGKSLCFSHYISSRDIEELVLGDIREMAQRIILDEDSIRENFIRYNEELADKAVKEAKGVCVISAKKQLNSA